MTAPALTSRMPADAAPRRSRIARYGLWQLRDYAINRGLPTFLVAAMFGGLAIFPMLKSIAGNLERMPAHYRLQMIAKHGSLAAFQHSMVHEASAAFLRSFIGTVVFLGALFATNGLVSNDLKQGYYRFLFSKPLSPARYYGQAFLVHTAGFLVVISLLGAIYGAYVEPLLTPTMLAAVGAAFLMYGGLGFLMTALVRWDWLALAGSAIVAQLLWDRFGTSTNILARLLYLLPPLHRTGEIYAALIGGTALPWRTVAWIATYGAACVIAGLVALRTRRLAIP